MSPQYTVCGCHQLPAACTSGASVWLQVAQHPKHPISARVSSAGLGVLGSVDTFRSHTHSHWDAWALSCPTSAASLGTQHARSVPGLSMGSMAEKPAKVTSPGSRTGSCWAPVGCHLWLGTGHRGCSCDSHHGASVGQGHGAAGSICGTGQEATQHSWDGDVQIQEASTGDTRGCEAHLWDGILGASFSRRGAALGPGAMQGSVRHGAGALWPARYRPLHITPPAATATEPGPTGRGNPFPAGCGAQEPRLWETAPASRLRRTLRTVLCRASVPHRSVPSRPAGEGCSGL